jgi:glucan-binding YG repeat protein
MAGAPKGNGNATKLKTPDLKKQAYESYCAHIASGESKEAWVFEHPTITLTSKTMEKYIRNDQIEFPPIHKEVAEAKSFQHWCNLGKQMMLGQIEKCQPAIFQMFMRNKFGWDKDDIDEVAECAADKILESIRKGSS